MFRQALLEGGGGHFDGVARKPDLLGIQSQAAGLASAQPFLFPARLDEQKCAMEVGESVEIKFQLFAEKPGEGFIKIVASERFDPGGAQHGVIGRMDSHHRGVKRAAAQVENPDGHLQLPRLGPVSMDEPVGQLDGGRGRLIKRADDRKTRTAEGATGEMALGPIGIGRPGEDRFKRFARGDNSRGSYRGANRLGELSESVTHIEPAGNSIAGKAHAIHIIPKTPLHGADGDIPLGGARLSQGPLCLGAEPQGGGGGVINEHRGEHLPGHAADRGVGDMRNQGVSSPVGADDHRVGGSIINAEASHGQDLRLTATRALATTMPRPVWKPGRMVSVTTPSGRWLSEISRVTV